MSVTAEPLYGPTALTTGDVALYTCPAATTAIIKRAVFSNTSGGAVTVTINVVRNGSSVVTANQMINPSYRSLAAGESWVSPELAGLVLTPSDAVHGLASSGSAVNLLMSGVLIT